MVFSSLPFLCVFLPIVLLVHIVLPNIHLKNAFLVMASLLFYAYGEPVYVLLMLVSTVVNWAFGRALGVANGALLRKFLIAVVVVLNLGFLAVFKYAAMTVASFNGISGLSIPEPHIALPIGISFYTFQAMSYIIDVYRGQVEPQRNYARVLLYISFFPQLIAGPIIKYHDIEAQLAHRQIAIGDLAYGMRRFCVGLAKKVLIANTMAVTVDALFVAPDTSINIAVAWLAGIAYVLQIYFDFSGYSDMAIGMARACGFHFKENFLYPYASTSIKEFWRRWHVSLSTWFKEYLYIPLGGNRLGRPRTVLNKLTVFFLCGLWHGAAWTFVVWGLIHGFFLLLEEYLPVDKLPKPVGWLYTMLVVTVAFVLFRADSFAQGGLFIQQMFMGFHFEYACVELAMRQLNPVFVGTMLVAGVAAWPIAPALREHRVVSTPVLVRIGHSFSFAGSFVLLLLCLLALSSGGYNPFIYFRF